jgi:hypothetical protein
MEALGINEILDLIKLVLAGFIGKLLVDVIKKGAKKVGLGMNRGTIQLFTLPAVYLVFYVIAKVSGKTPDLVNARLVGETVVAAMLAVTVNEAAKTDYVNDVLNIVAGVLRIKQAQPSTGGPPPTK